MDCGWYCLAQQVPTYDEYYIYVYTYMVYMYIDKTKYPNCSSMRMMTGGVEIGVAVELWAHKSAESVRSRTQNGW